MVPALLDKGRQWDLLGWAVTHTTSQLPIAVFDQSHVPVTSTGHKPFSLSRRKQTALVVCAKRTELAVTPQNAHRHPMVPGSNVWGTLSTYTYVHCGCTMALTNKAVHTWKNKPKFTKRLEKIHVCRLWVYLHCAPPRKWASAFYFSKTSCPGLCSTCGRSC